MFAPISLASVIQDGQQPSKPSRDATNSEQKIGSGERPGEKEESGSAEYAFPVKIIESPDDAERARERENKSNDREDKSLEMSRRSTVAAEEQAWLGNWQTVSGGIGAIAGIVGVVLAYLAFKAASDSAKAAWRAVKVTEGANKISEENSKKSIELMETALIETDRAWITVSTSVAELTMHQGYIEIKANYHIENVGGRVCPYYIRTEAFGSIGDVAKYTNGLRFDETNGSIMGFIFPNKDKISGIANPTISSEKVGNSYIVICVVYKLNGFNNFRYTAMAYRVGHATNGGNAGPDVAALQNNGRVGAKLSCVNHLCMIT
ncbi:hypothetical protein [Nitrospirillum amazonense]|uniref:hypothetical protein n=1 Tax=Nitrospirillum amazonense TaxID=28077 RepID=UPI00119F7769|nr:hypothetical protein [Nitrospirillum amazonense]